MKSQTIPSFPTIRCTGRGNGSIGINNFPELPELIVTAALIRHEGNVLIARRYGNKPRGGIWEFPGGTLEQNENLVECVIREISEETGLRISVKNLIGIVEHPYKDVKITLHLFDCILADDQQDSLEHHECKLEWLPLKDLESKQLCSADRKFLPLLMADEKEND